MIFMGNSNQISTQNTDKVKEILGRFRGNIDPENIDKKAIRLLSLIDEANGKKKDKIVAENSKFFDDFARMHEFDKHYLLAESLTPRFSTMAIRMVKSIIKEYDCRTVLEKSLAEIIASSFCRVLHLSTNLNRNLSGDSISISQTFVNYYNFLSKEIDKANRQYLNALTTLQQIKSPSIKVNLKAETAIVGQNQQFNSINSSQNETNKAN